MTTPTEDDLIQQWLKGAPVTGAGIILGPGDDCALWKPSSPEREVVLKVDSMVSGRHFKESDEPRSVGYKAVSRVVSDFAAMGAEPKVVLISAGVPLGFQNDWMEELYLGVSSVCQQWGMAIAGGETTNAEPFWVSITGVGEVAAASAAKRTGAQPGDLIFTTGELGGSFPDRHLSFLPRLREGQWLVKNEMVTAMIDLSDGLGKDLPRLASMSSVSFRVNTPSLPRHRDCSISEAVNDGEDYELLFTVEPDSVTSLNKKWSFPTRLTCIGEILEGTIPPQCDGVDFKGFDHFAEEEDSK